MKTYFARLEREKDGRWNAELEIEPRVHTWGKTVDQAISRMKEATALWFRTDEDNIDIVPHLSLQKSTNRSVDLALEARKRAREADRRASELTARAVTTLTDKGVSLRDSASIIGVSHQRVHQILSQSSNKQKPKSR